jgi:alpha-L-fucosidase
LPLSGKVAGARNLSGDAVRWTAGANGLTLSVPPASRGPAVTVVELKMAPAA